MIERWALVSGLKGDLETYELIQRDLKKARGVTALFVLGDMIGPERNCDALLNRLQNPLRGELKPNAFMAGGKSNYLQNKDYVASKRLMPYD